MKLSVLANPDCHCNDPNHVRFVGNPAGYIGRRYDAETGTYPVSSEPSVFDAEGRTGARVLKLLQRGEVLPADKQTADAAGVEFRPQPRPTKPKERPPEAAPEIK
jgi:hypothetical protein